MSKRKFTLRLKNRLTSGEIVHLLTVVTSYRSKCQAACVHVSCKLPSCKKWRRAADLKSWDGSGTVKGGRWEIKVQEVGEQSMGGGRF